jgi:hypothetical protein
MDRWAEGRVRVKNIERLLREFAFRTGCVYCCNGHGQFSCSQLNRTHFALLRVPCEEQEGT